MEIIFLLVMFVMYIAILGLALANYIIYSLSLYKMADKRNVSNAWLAWFPIGAEWILGSITDSFDEEKDKSHSWRKVLLISSVLSVILFFGSFIAMIISIVIGALNGIGEDQIMFFAPFLISYTGIIVGSVATIVLGATQIICYYRIYDEVCSQKTVKYLIFSLIVPLAMAICMLKCSTLCPEKTNSILMPDGTISNEL